MEKRVLEFPTLNGKTILKGAIGDEGYNALLTDKDWGLLMRSALEVLERLRVYPQKWSTPIHGQGSLHITCQDYLVNAYFDPGQSLACNVRVGPEEGYISADSGPLYTCFSEMQNIDPQNLPRYALKSGAEGRAARLLLNGEIDWVSKNM